MKIKLWPDLVDWPIEAYVSGDVITINDDEIDLSGIPEGFRLPGSAVGNKFFVETEFVERIGKTLHFTLRLPVAWDSPEKYRNPPEPIVIDARSGSVKFPDTTPPAPPKPEPGTDPATAEKEHDPAIPLIDTHEVPEDGGPEPATESPD